MTPKASYKALISITFRVLLLILVSSTSLFAQNRDLPANPPDEEEKVLELLQADVTEFDKRFLNAERVKGNVRFRHGTALMDCDSAWFYRDENRIEAYGHIYIRQQDTLNLWGDYLDYNGDTKLAKVKKNVRLKDQEMTLETEWLEYDLENKVAYYPAQGKIRNGTDRLRSRVGTYYSRSRIFYFKDSVVLVNPEYTMNSDTLQYNSWSKIAYFFGPTYIRSAENTIFCRYGWYDTKRNTSEFSKGAWIEGKENKLVADSMIYNRNTGVGQAFHQLVLIDTIEDVRITGEHGRYHRFEKKIWVSGDPMAVKYMDGDSLFLRADTLLDETDTADNKRKLLAYHNSLLHKSDMQGVADSLIYNFNDSTIHMFMDPILWAEGDQITADTLIIYRKNGELEKMDILKDAFIVSEEKPGYFNQVGGRNMLASFANNTLDDIEVFGNGRSLYYARETDSTYTGVNYIECREMLIDIDSNTVREITFYTKPEGTFYPVNELPKDKEKIKGFKWLIDTRPNLEDFTVKRKEEIESRPESIKSLLEIEESKATESTKSDSIELPQKNPLLPRKKRKSSSPE